MQTIVDGYMVLRIYKKFSNYYNKLKPKLKPVSGNNLDNTLMPKFSYLYKIDCYESI